MTLIKWGSMALLLPLMGCTTGSNAGATGQAPAERMATMTWEEVAERALREVTPGLC